jgi:putative sulfotransferase
VTAPDRSIIISSGRCGSTLLSDLLAEEPETLSVQESLTPFFGYSDNFSTIITGAEYWSLLSRPSLQQITMARIGIKSPEFRYPAIGRWAGHGAAVPPIITVTLPALSADPDHLFDILDAQVPRFPLQSAAMHHQMLLDLLASRAGRRRWVERSGGSSFIPGPILKNFPTAKVIYLTRNLTDTALSMSRHPDYQFAALQWEFLTWHGANPYSPGYTPEQRIAEEKLPEEMRRLLPDQLTAQALRDVGRDVSLYELMCAGANSAAQRALAECQPPHLLRMQYEDLVAEPIDQLTLLGDFLGFADAAGWAARTAGRISRKSCSPSIPAGTRRKRESGCAG